MTKRIIPTAILFLAAAGCAAGQPEAVDLPPPCTPDVAARVLADSSAAISLPAPTSLAIPPERPGGVPPGTYRLTVTIGVNGQVVPGSVRVAGSDHPAYTRRLVRWAEGMRFRPATAEGCALPHETIITVQT